MNKKEGVFLKTVKARASLAFSIHKSNINRINEIIWIDRRLSFPKWKKNNHFENTNTNENIQDGIRSVAVRYCFLAL